MRHWAAGILIAVLTVFPGDVGAETHPELPGFQILSTRAVGGAVEYETAYMSGSLSVRAFVYLAESAEPRPLVVFNHGGISGVSPDMKRRSVDLVQAGYTVITPSYRGEDGGEGNIEVAAGEVDDVIIATRLMRGSPRVDPARAAIIGSSHGALISVLAAARQPHLYSCVAAACGVMDVTAWYRWLVANGFDVSDSLTTAIYGRGPEDKPQAFARRRALNQAPHLNDPLLLQYGLKDRIVPPEQGLVMQEAMLRYARTPVTFAAYPLLGHAFWFWNDLTRHTRADIDQAASSWTDLLQFLETHLAP